MTFDFQKCGGFRFAAVLLFSGIVASTAAAQSDSTNDNTVGDEVVLRLIANLDADSFRLRQQATRDLVEIGEPAAEPLRQLRQTGSPEQRLRAEFVLAQIQNHSFSVLLAELQASPSAGLASRLPCWDRFSELAGSDPRAVAFFISLLAAEPQLFTACQKNRASVPALLRARVSELQESLAPGPLTDSDASAESIAAVLLISGDRTVRLPGATSTTVSMLALSDVLKSKLSPADAEAELYRRLAGAWVLREGIAPQRPLLLAQTYRLPEGPPLARRVLKTALRGTNGWYAMTLLAQQGSRDDLPLLESLFDNHQILFAATQNPDEDAYRVEIGDVALATSLVLRGEDPRRFGFPDVTPQRPYSMALDSTGFATEAARSAAVEKYRERFSDSVPQK
ncbi:MAG: hypothetical protein R3C19_14120 [Planctomycetaceae bacterium]